MNDRSSLSKPIWWLSALVLLAAVVIVASNRLTAPRDAISRAATCRELETVMVEAIQTFSDADDLEGTTTELKEVIISRIEDRYEELSCAFETRIMYIVPGQL